MSKIKVIIINKSQHTSKLLKNVIHGVESFEVIGPYHSIDEGVKQIKQTSPNVILLDINLVHDDKTKTIQQLLTLKTIPIVIISTSAVDEVTRTIRVILQGAIDFITIDEATESISSDTKEIIVNKLQNARNIQLKKLKKITQSKMKKKNKQQEKVVIKKEASPPVLKQVQRKSSKKGIIVAIGCSTGGPRALHQMIENMPKDFQAPIFIVQHMPKGFTRSFAERLNRLGTIQVKEATEGEIVQNGTAYIAPGSYHMKVVAKENKLAIALTKEKARSGHRPSVDELFDSVAKLSNYEKIIVVLTGMGKDGAEGVLNIKHLDDEAIILAESKETAIINGMPQAVVETNQVTEIVRLEEMTNKVVQYVKDRSC